MLSGSDSQILAIDGGGTRCRVALVRDDIRTVVESGSANITTNFESTSTEILRAVEHAFETAQLGKKEIGATPAFVGLAGMTDPEMAIRLQSKLPFRHVRIDDDRPAALRGALGDAEGFLAHCGTGSFFMSRLNGNVRGVGGWGPVLGDSASAQWIGRKALSLTVDAADELTDHTPLTLALLELHGSCTGIVRFAAEALPSDFGDLAPHVTKHAGSGDKNARALMQMGADHIASNLTQLGWSRGLPICLTGGIGPEFASFFPPDMQNALAEPMGSPLDGAISLAQEFGQEVADERR